MAPGPSRSPARSLLAGLIRVVAAPVVIGLVMVPPPGAARPAGDDDKELREFQRAFKRVRHPMEALERRAAALAELAGDDRPPTARALIDAFVQVEEEVLPTAERHLAAVTTVQRAGGFEYRPLLDAQRELQDDLLAALLARADPAGWAYVLERVLADDDLPLSLRLAAAGSPGAARAEPLARALGLMKKNLSRADRRSSGASGARVALAAARALGPRAAELLPGIVAALGHDRPDVRVAAAEALGALEQPGALEPLVSALGRERGRTRRALAAVLEVLTRRRIGTSAEAWQLWLEREGGPFLAGAEPLGGGAPELEPDESARYHGIPLEGDSILFLIDRSRSMNKPLARRRVREDARAAVRRIERAKSELIAALRALGPEVRFSVVGFGASMEVFEDEPVPASPAEVARALEWIEELPQQAGTNVYGALEAAFHLAGRGAEDADWTARFDTLFLLSDGKPYVAGAHDSTERILSAARRWNCSAQVTIHTIGLGDEVPADFMGALAREHRGRFVLETGTGSVDLSTRPNVVLFVVDDLGWRDAGFAGSEVLDTPRMDGLAAAGMRFENAYSNAPNCAPSRACLLTGLYPPRHGIYTVLGSARGPASERALVPVKNTTELREDLTTLAEVFAGAGYATGAVGKWHLGDDPRDHGFDRNVGGSAAGHPVSYFSPYANPALADGPEGEFLTERLTDAALEFVRESAGGPFFLYLSHYGVHAPLQAPEALRAKYVERLGDGPAATYAAMVESIDESLGRVLDLLRELDLEERTLVCFTSDNGALSRTTSMAPLRGQKGSIYEAGIRVPLVVSWPGRVSAGASAGTPVIGSDLFPTLAQLAGASAPAVDGESLVPLLLGDGTLDREAVFWHFPVYLEPYGDSPGFRARPCGAVRRGRYKLIEFFEDGRLELYNLRADPGETVNLAGESGELAGVRDELHALLRDWRVETGAPVPTERNPEYRK